MWLEQQVGGFRILQASPYCILEMSQNNLAWDNFINKQDQSCLYGHGNTGQRVKGFKALVGWWQRLTSGPDAYCQFDILMLEQLRLTETNYLEEIKLRVVDTSTHTEETFGYALLQQTATLSELFFFIRIIAVKGSHALILFLSLSASAHTSTFSPN